MHATHTQKTQRRTIKKQRCAITHKHNVMLRPLERERNMDRVERPTERDREGKEERGSDQTVAKHTKICERFRNVCAGTQRLGYKGITGAAQQHRHTRRKKTFLI